PAIFAANAIKATGARVIAVGVGDGVSGNPANLRAVSGEQGYGTGVSPINADFFQTGWQDLANALEDIAAGATCQATVEVRKAEVDQQGQSKAGIGWTFTPELDGQGATLVPGGAQQTAVNGNGYGVARWNVKYAEPNSPGVDVTLTEEQRDGFVLDSVSCTVNGQPVDAPGADGTFTVSDVAPGDSVVCTVVNKVPEKTYEDLTVTKTVEASFDRAYTWDIDKVAPTTEFRVPEGDEATVAYDVEVTAVGTVDSGWTLQGDITVTNPNDEDIS